MKKMITAVAVLALGTSLAFAHPGGEFGGKGKRGRHGKAGIERFAQELNLSEGQKLQIQELNKSFKEQNKTFFDQTRETRMQFREAKKANDTARMEALKPTMEAQKAQMKQLRDAHHQRVLQLLTPDQRAKLDALKAERQARREGQRNNQR